SPAVPKAPATGSIHPIPASPARPSEPRRSGWPRRSRIAAAGRTAIGIIRLRPRRWSRASATEERLRSLGVAEELAAGGRLKGFLPELAPLSGTAVSLCAAANPAWSAAGSGRHGMWTEPVLHTVLW